MSDPVRRHRRHDPDAGGGPYREPTLEGADRSEVPLSWDGPTRLEQVTTRKGRAGLVTEQVEVPDRKAHAAEQVAEDRRERSREFHDDLAPAVDAAYAIGRSGVEKADDAVAVDEWTDDDLAAVLEDGAGGTTAEKSAAASGGGSASSTGSGSSGGPSARTLVLKVVGAAHEGRVSDPDDLAPLEDALADGPLRVAVSGAREVATAIRDGETDPSQRRAEKAVLATAEGAGGGEA